MKKRSLFLFFLLAVSLLLPACSAAGWDRATDYGNPKLVISNGGQCVNLIAISEGRVEDVSQSVRWVELH
jgi:hypothetical protein